MQKSPQNIHTVLSVRIYKVKIFKYKVLKKNLNAPSVPVAIQQFIFW